MEIYLPTVDGNVITKWDKESVIEVEISNVKRSIKYEQLIYFNLFYRNNFCNNHLSFGNKTSP